ncbi:flagellar biosynthesis protein FlhB [Pseudoxanthomonas suwonensis]|uniref:Flagellar biosynthetic protein FlhB n=1 Tax=Pseudoxanthomonas suwonensis TaxID=314722 RepID=A0A0E3Z3K9_9GAMM|nr:flagellar biosynthesis protein FlhB [Pseudoxanthomonas suwonensis]AKC87972.1 flagellar biosynthesis protein FlhB [Pseudoxanthomonas suwonensis]
MAENEDGQERTEQPSAKRLREAREKGNIPRSRELATAAVFGAGVAALLAAGPLLARGAQGWMRGALSPEPALLQAPERLFGHMGLLLLKLLWVVLPLVAVSLLAALLAPLAMGGLQFSNKALTPDLNRLNPAAGLKRIYGPEGLAELAKSLLRVALVGTAAGLTLSHGMDLLRTMPNQGLEDAARTGLHFTGRLLLATACALALLAAIDAPYQKWNWMRKLKMTRQELRDELKESEGNPQVKGKIRQMQAQLSQRRMMEAVPTADVIVVNPTHYAVALKYESGSMRAPTVVAKGVDEMAQRIREVADRHRVATVSAPPLARALYREGELGKEIPVRLYAAVAQILSYVYQLRAWRAGTAPASPELGPVAVDEFPAEPGR